MLNSPYGPSEVWEKLPAAAQKKILENDLRFFVVNADEVARNTGLRGRINTVMQTCFFALSGILPLDEAIERIKESIRKSYAGRGESILKKNFAAVDGALDALAVQQGMNVVANECPAERDGVRRKAAAPAQRDVHARNMKGL